MKNTIYIILVLFSIVSCKNKVNDFALISGTINDKKVDSLFLHNASTNFKKSIAINDDGTFNDTLVIDKVKAYKLSSGKNWYSIFLQNNYNLNINISKDSTNSTISFSGIGADVNNYYRSKAVFIKEKIKLSSLPKLSEQDFTRLANKVTDSASAMLQNALIEDKNFITFETENIFWNEISNYMMYHYLKQNEAYRDTTKTYTPSSGFLPQAFLSFKSDNEDLYINSESYSNLSNVIPIRTINFKDLSDRNSDEKIKFIDSICSTIGIPLVKDFTLKNVGFRFLNDENQEVAKTYLDYFTSILSDEDIKTEFTDFYNKNQRLKKGALSSKFTNYENFAGGTTSLDDLKGKYVYIDVWATWCGPCKKEIPFLKDVEKKYHGKNIEFVSISVDTKPAYDSWKKMVTDKELTGIQLFADNAFDSKFIKDYNIKAIPRFILIDPEGKIVNSKAPRPSNPDLIDLFNQLEI
ncbi:TlpA family protein disulfide reductase [Flavivirga spongiicola]|uniref:TlpA family protein disulfide reductase n=1 Tax=Flavivirga spongiicola TaxID=421621 RepID=A0ABU7XS28_9FLAO|nr:TlpA disulfide reductase family protein [Flavivirga sp. MEBiC05379]MDO5978375.1 TlpA disulfide reductase family protein [Flavivirga sp. MEBiC05379]